MNLTTILLVVMENIKIWLLKLAGMDTYIFPYKALINLTDLCNSRCQFCGIWKKKRNETRSIDFESVDYFFRQMGKNLIWLSLSGGEVTLYNQFQQMINQAKKRCKRLRVISFTTNGLNPEKALAYAKYIRDSQFEAMVTISLDGDRRLHDQLRGVEGNFEKCMKLYTQLKKEKIPVHFGITVSAANSAFIQKDYPKWKHDIKAVTFVHSNGIYNQQNEEDMSSVLRGLKKINKHYAIDHLSEIIEKIHIKTAIQFIETGLKKNIIPCEVLNTSIHIMPDGGIYPCMYLNKLGEIPNDSISDLMKSNKVNNLKKAIHKDQCPHCWMNCYSPFSIMQHPFKSLKILIRQDHRMRR